MSPATGKVKSGKSIRLRFRAHKKLTLYIERVTKAATLAMAKRNAKAEAKAQAKAKAKVEELKDDAQPTASIDDLEAGEIKNANQVADTQVEDALGNMGDLAQNDNTEHQKHVVESDAKEYPEIGVVYNETTAFKNKKDNKEEKVDGRPVVLFFGNANAVLPGLSTVRHLGNGFYEIINLSATTIQTLQSKGCGALGLHKNVDRANAFYLAGYQWTDIIEKFALASRYSGELYSLIRPALENPYLYLSR